jgi:hypothetical protein
MIFTLEALQALHGDSLILHYGPTEQPRFILIDGGPDTVFETQLGPRLDALRARWAPGEALPLQMVMVSHIDDDHINGVLALTSLLAEAKADHQPAPYRVMRLWHNSFDDVLGNAGEEIVSTLGASTTAAAVAAAMPAGVSIEPDVAAVVASVAQGRQLRDHARRLDLVPVNAPFKGLVMAPEAGGVSFAWGNGLSLTVVNPDERRVRNLQKKWDEAVKAARARGDAAALAAAYTDRSVYNLSSIVVLAELGGKRMLLTGDARGDDILAGLGAAGRLTDDRIEVDVLKLPHHGSDRNVDTDFFRRIIARHYVVSADGEYDNPEIATFQMISQARRDDDFTLHLTNRDGKNDPGKPLTAFFDKELRTRTYKVAFRDVTAPSLKVDLLDAVAY